MLIRSAIIGTGDHAEIWSKQIKNHAKYKLEYIVSNNYERGKNLANKFNCKYINKDENLLDNKNIDLAILTSTPNKNKYAIDLAEKKIDLIIEKPLALNSVDCSNIQKSCNKNKILCGSGLKRYFDTYFETIKEYQKVLGNCYLAELNIIHSNDTENAYQFSTDSVERYGNIFLGHLIHYFVQLNKIFGIPQSIFANPITRNSQKVLVSTNLIIKYEKNLVLMNVINGTDLDFGETITLYCEKGLIEVNFNTQTVQMIKNPFNNKLSRPLISRHKASLLKGKFASLKLKKIVASENFYTGTLNKVLDSFSNIRLNLKDDEIVNIDKQYISAKMSLACETSIENKKWVNL
jgi:predicted dehydrogenase